MTKLLFEGKEFNNPTEILAHLCNEAVGGSTNWEIMDEVELDNFIGLASNRLDAHVFSDLMYDSLYTAMEQDEEFRNMSIERLQEEVYDEVSMRLVGMVLKDLNIPNTNIKQMVEDAKEECGDG